MFSAFYDQRKGQRTVRVIGATKTRGPERVWCRMWYKISEFNTSAHISITIPAKIKVRQDLIPYFHTTNGKYLPGPKPCKRGDVHTISTCPKMFHQHLHKFFAAYYLC